MQPIVGNKKRKKGSKFPARLHDMMEYVESQGLDSILSWVLNGRGFIIHDPDKLVEILPLFFSQTKYRSFRRQLCMWHFERIPSGPHKGAFLHPYFVKGNRSLCTQISRQIFCHKKSDDKPSSPTSSRSGEDSASDSEVASHASDIFSDHEEQKQEKKPSMAVAAARAEGVFNRFAQPLKLDQSILRHPNDPEEYTSLSLFARTNALLEETKSIIQASEDVMSFGSLKRNNMGTYELTKSSSPVDALHFDEGAWGPGGMDDGSIDSFAGRSFFSVDDGATLLEDFEF